MLTLLRHDRLIHSSSLDGGPVYAVKVQIIKVMDVMVRAGVSEMEDVVGSFGSRGSGGGKKVISGCLMHQEEEYDWLRNFVEKWNDDQSYMIDPHDDDDDMANDSDDDAEDEVRKGSSRKKKVKHRYQLYSLSLGLFVSNFLFDYFDCRDLASSQPSMQWMVWEIVISLEDV